MGIVELYFGVAGLLMIVLAILCLKNKRRIDGDDIHNILGLAGLWPFLFLGLLIGVIDWVKNMRKLKGVVMENDIHAQLLWQVLHIIKEHRNNAQTLADQLLFQNLLHEIVELLDEVEYGSGDVG